MQTKWSGSVSRWPPAVRHAAMGASCMCLYIACVIAITRASPGAAPLVKLRDGNEMPQLGLGTWLGYEKGVRVEPTGDEVEKSVAWAIEAGYRHIDTAHIYSTEEQVGRAVNKKIADGTVSRSELFVATKLWNDKHQREDVAPALRESLAKLSLDYIDLYLIHWPIAQYANGTYYDADYTDTWQGMVEAKKLNLTRSIGVSNFNQAQLDRLLATSTEVPAVLQVEINLNLQQPELLKYCKEHNIAVTGYTPFGSLFPTKAKEDAPEPRVNDPALVAIASKYNRTVPQINLKYLMQLGVTPLPKSLTKSRIEQNIDLFDFQLANGDLLHLSKYNSNYRTLPQHKWMQNEHYPFEKHNNTK